MKQKRVLLLNASHNDELLLMALKEMNCYVITTGNRPNLPGHKLADEYVYGNYTDLDAMYALAVEKQVDAVCPCCNDFGVKTAAYIMDKMGKSGQDCYETTLLFHDKDKFKSMAAQLGDISTPIAVPFHNLDAALVWARTVKHEYPLIVKAVDLSAGNGIRRADNLFQLEDNIHHAFEKSRVKRIVVEPFIEGSQHGFTAFLINQKVVAATSDNEYSFLNPYRVEVASTPAKHIDKVQENLICQIEHMAQALTLSDGIFHLQYIYRDGKAYILECMRRVLGNLYGITAMDRCDGFNWDYWEAKVKCGFGCEDFPEEVTQSGFWGFRALIAKENGVFESVEIAEDIHKYIYRAYHIQNPGYEITNHLSDPVGLLFMRFSSEAEMDDVLLNRYEDISVKVKTNYPEKSFAQTI